MNKQELIQKIAERKYIRPNESGILSIKYKQTFNEACDEIISLAEQLDEQQNENHLHDIKSQIKYLFEHGPGKNKSLKMLDNMVDNMLQGNWALARVQEEKVKVPTFVAAYIEKSKEGPYPFLGEALDKPWASNFEVADWLQIFDDLDGIDEEQAVRNQEIFARAWLDGYEVEEEPKWIVRIGKVYLTGNQSYSFYKEDATPFEIEKFAEEAAEKTGGTVEKV